MRCDSLIQRRLLFELPKLHRDRGRSVNVFPYNGFLLPTRVRRRHDFPSRFPSFSRPTIALLPRATTDDRHPPTHRRSGAAHRRRVSTVSPPSEYPARNLSARNINCHRVARSLGSRIMSEFVESFGEKLVTLTSDELWRICVRECVV